MTNPERDPEPVSSEAAELRRVVESERIKRLGIIGVVCTTIGGMIAGAAIRISDRHVISGGIIALTSALSLILLLIGMRLGALAVSHRSREPGAGPSSRFLETLRRYVANEPDDDLVGSAARRP